MTAYEEYDFREDGIAVLPATPQTVWADQVFKFAEVLRQEMARFEQLRAEDGDLFLDDGSSYVEGYEDAAETLRDHFYKIFGISETPAV